jgi:hypothetical protein
LTHTSNSTKSIYNTWTSALRTATLDLPLGKEFGEESCSAVTAATTRFGLLGYRIYFKVDR